MNTTAVLESPLEKQIGRYSEWRNGLLGAIEEYRGWLENNGELDAQHTLRFFELSQSIRQGRLTLAFVAEYSRGKSELINALFFSDFKQRLLPSDVGRTTMCPTEIFHDANEKPYLRLLPIESRYRDETILQLKNMPVEWVKINLNLGSVDDTRDAMQMLAETKKIFTPEARMMGLLHDADAPNDDNEELDTVEVPAWRYALINYPHYLLSNGIAIVDTPGLNALGLEPELTLSIIPNAHAVLFLLGIDTGVTKSDMEVWTKYVRGTHTHRVAVLNKIDLMWDELKTDAEIAAGIARQAQETARLLELPARNVLAISAQKALIGKIRHDQGLVKKSGIEQLERMLADDLIPSKQKILSRAIMTEIGGMMLSSRDALERRADANQTQLREIEALAGRNRSVTTKLWEKITGDEKVYIAAVEEYKRQRSEFNRRREVLVEMLNPVKVEFLLGKNRASIEGTWTTAGLGRAMQELIKSSNDEFTRVYALSETMKVLMQQSYDHFHAHYRFQKLIIPSLDLENLRLKLQLLMHHTLIFARDPINIMTEKSFLVRKFFNGLVSQAQLIFAEAGAGCERWLNAVTVPLEAQIRDHKAQLEKRLSNLSKINENGSALQESLLRLKAEHGELVLQQHLIDKLIGKLDLKEPMAA